MLSPNHGVLVRGPAARESAPEGAIACVVEVWLPDFHRLARCKLACAEEVMPINLQRPMVWRCQATDCVRKGNK
jgi:hypothetical protein